jgi:hypothetical protein
MKTDSIVIDKSEIIRLMEEFGIQPDEPFDELPTGELAQKMTRDLGIAEEENILSCGIIAARDED